MARGPVAGSREREAGKRRGNGQCKARERRAEGGRGRSEARGTAGIVREKWHRDGYRLFPGAEELFPKANGKAERDRRAGWDFFSGARGKKIASQGERLARRGRVPL